MLNYFKIRTMLSKHHDLQKQTIWRDCVNEKFCKIVKLQNDDVKKMMILKMLKYIRSIKISMMSYILVVHVMH